MKPDRDEELKRKREEDSPRKIEEQKEKSLLDANAPRSDYQERKEKEVDDDDRFGDYGFFFLEDRIKEEAIT